MKQLQLVLVAVALLLLWALPAIASQGGSCGSMPIAVC